MSSILLLVNSPIPLTADRVLLAGRHHYMHKLTLALSMNGTFAPNMIEHNHCLDSLGADSHQILVEKRRAVRSA